MATSGICSQLKTYAQFQAEVQQQEISLRYLENQPLPPLSISKYDYYFHPTVIIKFQASDLLLVTVAVPTQLLHYFSVQVTLVLYCTALYCTVVYCTVLYCARLFAKYYCQGNIS